MTEKILTIDFETKDPYIGLKLGAGWAYAYNITDSLFKPLGAALCTHDGTTEYIINWDMLIGYILSHDALLAHNATYDIGILYVLYKDNKRVIDKLKSMPIYDTKLLFKLYNNSLDSYSLDSLAKKYLKEDKGHQTLIDAVWENDLYPWLKKELNEKTRAEKRGLEYTRVKPSDVKILKYAYSNMDIIQEADFGRMAEYALSDVDLTRKLYEFVCPHLDKSLTEKYSLLTHICVGYRLRGVRIDLKKAQEISAKLIPIITAKHQEIYDLIGEEINIGSPLELPKAFDKLNIKYPKTKKGKPSITSPWLEKQTHTICKLIVEARKHKKIKTDFIEKILEMQKYTCPDAKDYGRVYPELNILEARTGRFSSSNPNIQQIPSRDEILGPLCRGLFVPEEGEKFFALDYSNQEGRLQVHYAKLLGCDGANELAILFNENPNLDMHQRIADLAGLSRRHAKTINLGISYGMGVQKLGEALGVDTKQATELKKKYDLMSPFLKQLSNFCTRVMKERGYIKTLSGRKSYADNPIYVDGELKTFEYKALNKLIQGSACDQIIEAMIHAYKNNIPVLFPVHDELVMTGTREQAEELKKIMETCVTLMVPSVVEIGEGNNWGEC